MDEKYTILFYGKTDIYSPLLSQLEKSGYKLIIKENHVPGEVDLQMEQADLVLLDISLKDCNMILESIRSNYSLMDLPVILLTKSSDTPQVIKALEQGANDYISPPLDSPAVLCRIKNQLKLKRAEQLLKESEERYAMAAQAANEGLWDWHVDKQKVFVCETWQKITGYPAIGKMIDKEILLNLVMDADRELFIKELENLTCGLSERIEIEHRIITKKEEYIWVLTTAIPVKNSRNETIRIVGSILNISGGRLHNNLTGLPNSLLIRDRLEQQLKGVKNNRTPASCVLFIDINRFRYINQAYGMSQGDQILKEIANRINIEIRDNDTLAHPGRDEFIVIMDQFHDLRKISRKVNQLLSSINNPILLANKSEKIRVSASIGVVIADKGYSSPERVIQDAESAMSTAKGMGVNRFHFFSNEQYISVKKTFEKEERLRQALEKNELELYYQPQIDLETGRIAGFEALVRWIDPERGMILPSDFIPLAEKSDIILQLGEWVLNKACRQIVQWLEEEVPPVKVSVNISPLQIIQGNFAETLQMVLKNTGVPPELLELEITESHAMDNPEKSLELMGKLCSMGVKLSIDDFGTGYSSLAALRDFPVSTLKIDKSFIQDIPECGNAMAIVKTIIAMAQTMNFTTIAEGVETVEQLEYLQEIGCRSFQGFLKSRAVSPHQAVLFLTDSALRPSPYY